MEPIMLRGIGERATTGNRRAWLIPHSDTKRKESKAFIIQMNVEKTEMNRKDDEQQQEQDVHERPNSPLPSSYKCSIDRSKTRLWVVDVKHEQLSNELGITAECDSYIHIW